MIYDYICTSDLCMYIVTRIIKKIETLFYILHLQIYVYKLWERDNHMKIEVGPAELLSTLHPFSFFVFPPWQYWQFHLQRSCWLRWDLQNFPAGLQMLQNNVSFFWSHDSALTYAWRNVWEKVHHSLGGHARTSAGTRKAQEYMNLKCCQGAVPTTSMWWAREVLALPWRKKCRA